MDELLREFLTESAENLGKLDNEIVELEQRPDDISLLNGVFRTIHTIKGTCGFLALERLESVAHAAENVLDALRSGTLQVRADLIGDVLRAIDCIRMILEHLEASETEPAGDDSALIANLERWLGAQQHEPGIESASTRTIDGGALADLFADGATTPIASPATAADELQSSRSDAEAATVAATIPATIPATAGGLSDGTLDAAHAGRRKDDHDVVHSTADSTLRVGVGLLDQLMNLVGELALGRNRLMQLAAVDEDSDFVSPVHQINRVTSDLLEAVMRTRMQPIGNAWTKLPRLVRDLSASNGKLIMLEMHGAETELDRQVLQAIQDPLTHMVRNSADHGVEAPERRVAAGKAAHGTIRLSARHEGGHVVIEIADDGAGINVARVREKALERGLAKAEALSSMPDAQALRFIFEPGFSTAAQVTNVSGRGVGMDVVRSNIELIGGTVDLTSKHGQGTTVRVKIPLTLAIVSALLVGSGGETFAVPQIGVVELVRVTEEQHALIEHVNNARFFRLRDTLLPLVSLQSLLRLTAPELTRPYNIIVCQVGTSRFGLVVQEVFDTQEIVVKPVGRLAKHLQCYAGCTITGDGRVIMILDTVGIATMACVASHEAGSDTRPVNQRSGEEPDAATKESVILFDAGFPALQAVPLSLVARLEEFPQSMIEDADGRFLVQYRGDLIPVVSANAATDMRARDPRPVIVFNDGERVMGLGVDNICDIVEEHINFVQRSSRAGVRGVCVIAGRATEVIDTAYFLQFAHGLPADAHATGDDHGGLALDVFPGHPDRDLAVCSTPNSDGRLPVAA